MVEALERQRLDHGPLQDHVEDLEMGAQRHYDGFLRKGRIRARSANPQQGLTGEALSHEAVMKIALPMLALLILGTGIWAYKVFLK